MTITTLPIIYAALVFVGLSLSACSKGKDCSQLYHDTISFENRTNRDLRLEFVDTQNEPYSVEMHALETANHKTVNEYYKTHEGTITKGGMPSNGQCTSEPLSLAKASFLSKRSFGEVKNCWDNENGRSIIVETSDSCPNGTFEQNKPGVP